MPWGALDILDKANSQRLGLSKQRPGVGAAGNPVDRVIDALPAADSAACYLTNGVPEVGCSAARRSK